MDANRRNRRREPVRNPNAQNLENIMANADQPVERAVGQTEKKRRLDLLGRERKKVRVKGWEEKLLSKLIKKKKKIGASLNTFKTEYIKTTGEENVPEGQYNFFFKFLRTSTDVRKLPIARNLFLRPVLIPLYQTLDLSYVTNDSLFWYFQLNIFRGLEYANCFANVKSIYLCSNKLVRQKESYMDEYFFEDFSVVVSSPLWNSDLGTTANDLNGTLTFSIFGKEYNRYTFNNNADAYALASLPLDEVINKLNDQTAINMKGKLSEGIKEIKKSGDFFYNGKIKLTDFCPSVLRSFTLTSFGALSFFEIDPNAYVDNCVRTRNLIEIPNLIYWDYLHSSMELIGVIKLTTNILEGDNNEKKVRFRSAYEAYIENKNVFTDYKAHFILFRKIILMFLDSFRVRANIDKMKEISKLCDQFITEDERLNEFGEQKSMFRLFCTNVRELATMMFNYSMLGNQVQYISAIDNVCKLAFRTTKNPGELSNNLRAVCVKVSELLYNGSKPVIDSIRSVNAFLGSMTGGNLNAIMNLAQNLMEQANLRRNDDRAINNRRMRERIYAVQELNRRLEPSLIRLATGKTAEQINGDQVLLSTLTDYFDSLRLTEQQIPQNNPVYAILPEGIKGFFNQRFLNNQNNNLMNLLNNENVLANVRIRGMRNDDSTDEEDLIDNNDDIGIFLAQNPNPLGNQPPQNPNQNQQNQNQNQQNQNQNQQNQNQQNQQNQQNRNQQGRRIFGVQRIERVEEAKRQD